ncbi:hypothetical protein GCM10025876_13590 [Demequina litorisediminis]|uniref:Uncharacterized protein n=1 Tax=Demequina litorisediminis TaxID=1849022 RepID=A0ABQ6IBJ4_9MICO|nr:hypothetical protein GCM10025876_13590 [Demequina litorisediminis]
MRDAVAVVAALARQGDAAIGPRVEVRAAGDEVPDPVRPLRHEGPHRLGRTQARARDERVLEVLLRRVLRVERRGDAALCPHRGAGAQDALGDDEHAVHFGAQFEGGRESSDPRADHEHVGGDGPTRCRRGKVTHKGGHGPNLAACSPTV